MHQAITRKDVAIECLFPSGGWALSCFLADGSRFRRRYFDYTSAEALYEFLETANEYAARNVIGGA